MKKIHLFVSSLLSGFLQLTSLESAHADHEVIPHDIHWLLPLEEQKTVFYMEGSDPALLSLIAERLAGGVLTSSLDLAPFPIALSLGSIHSAATIFSTLGKHLLPGGEALITLLSLETREREILSTLAHMERWQEPLQKLQLWSEEQIQAEMVAQGLAITYRHYFTVPHHFLSHNEFKKWIIYTIFKQIAVAKNIENDLAEDFIIEFLKRKEEFPLYEKTLLIRCQKK